MEQMYILYENGEPKEYRYGEDWVAMELFMEGGFKTEQEAKDYWEKTK